MATLSLPSDLLVKVHQTCWKQE